MKSFGLTRSTSLLTKTNVTSKYYLLLPSSVTWTILFRLYIHISLTTRIRNGVAAISAAVDISSSRRKIPLKDFIDNCSFRKSG